MNNGELGELRVGDNAQRRHVECFRWVGHVISVNVNGRNTVFEVDFGDKGKMVCQRHWLWKLAFVERNIPIEQTEEGLEASETDSQSSSDTEEESSNDDDNDSHVSVG